MYIVLATICVQCLLPNSTAIGPAAAVGGVAASSRRDRILDLYAPPNFSSYLETVADVARTAPVLG